MRRPLLLVLVAAALLGGAWLLRSAMSASAPAPISKPAASSRPSPFPPGARTLLNKSLQAQAAAVGGFEQVPQSLLNIDRPMTYGDSVWNEAGVPAGPVTVRVDLRTQLLSVFRAGHEIGTALVLYGADAKETPLGRFPILWKGKNHRSSLYDAPMPYTMRLTGDGVALHGSNVRWGAATHGCIGIPTDFAERLYAVAKVGDPVTILRSTAAAGSAGGRLSR